MLRSNASFMKSKPPGIIQAIPGHPFTRGLIGAWPLGDSLVAGLPAYDASYLHNFGKNQNSGMVLVPGPRGGYATKFNGTNNYILMPHLTAYDLTAEVTMSAWVNAVAYNGFAQIVCNRTGSSTPVNWGLEIGSDAKLAFYYTHTGPVYDILKQSTASMSTGNWYHVAASFVYASGATTGLYINGSTVTATWTNSTGTSAPVITTAQICIGATNDNAVRWSGSIENVRVYNRALSAQEIYTLYVDPYIGFTSAQMPWLLSDVPAAAAGKALPPYQRTLRFLPRKVA